MPVLQSEKVKSKIWAFVISSLVTSVTFTFIYSRFNKKATITEGLIYGFFMGCWIGCVMSLNTYAATDLVPFSLAIQWLIYTVIQYTISGGLLAFVYNLTKPRHEF
jgi:hypothetical protein